jgi:hypothetical protein
MFTKRVSIIIGDRNPHHHVLEKAVRIIKEKFNGEFTVTDLISLDSFSTEEKKYLINMFSHNVTGVEAWEHNFYLEKGTWKYEESEYDYKKQIRDLLMLLNTNKTAIGEIVYTNDYGLIENLWHDWLNLLDYETRWVLYEYHYFDEKEFIEFVCHNLKSRIGDSCIFNFEFLKTFMEAKKDYHAYCIHQILYAALGIKKAS